MAGWVVVVPTLWTGLCVATRPNALVHGEDPWTVSDLLAKRVTSEEVAERPLVEASLAQSGVEAAPTPAVGRSQGQVDRLRDRSGGQGRVAKLEGGVGTALHAGVKLLAETSQVTIGVCVSAHRIVHPAVWTRKILLKESPPV